MELVYQFGILPETDISVSSGTRKGSSGPFTPLQTSAIRSPILVTHLKRLPRLTP